MSTVPVHRVISTVSVLVGFLALLVFCAYVVRRTGTTAGLRDVAVAFVRTEVLSRCGRSREVATGCGRLLPQGLHLEQLLEGLQDVAHSGRWDACPTVGDRRRKDASRPPARIAAFRSAFFEILRQITPMGRRPS
jgi:hypothetical protein